MRLIPDFNFIGQSVSLQDPFTINNDLIIRASITGTLNENSRIHIETFGNQVYIFDYFAFNRAIMFVAAEIRGFRYIDERGREYINVIDNSSIYIEEIGRQIRRYNNRNEISNDMLRLNNQGRCLNLSISDENILSTTFECDRNDPQTLNATTGYTTSNGNINLGRITLNPNSITFHINSESSNNYIHGYDYKPEYKHHILETESFPLLLGAEIEVAGNTDEKISRSDVVKKCIQIMNRSDSDKEDLIYSTHDSTVQIELDIMPCSLEYHKTMNYKEMFKYLDELGYKGHDCNSAGLHIHADRKYLGKTPLKQQLVISKILYILEKFNDEICIIARRNNSYSQFIGNGKNENSVVELYGKYKDKGKYVALNLNHPETIEFRCFKSTLKYETFILTLEFVKDIIDYAKAINIEEIELIQWSDLMDTFSDELKEYYNERLKKEKAKNALYSDSDLIKQKKKEIKSLKKKIKNCDNYMERKNLNKELVEAQKELKKLQRSLNNYVNIPSIRDVILPENLVYTGHVNVESYATLNTLYNLCSFSLTN